MRNRSWQNVAVLIVGITCVITLGLVLLADTTTFALDAPDPRTGRIKGCYTIIDDLLRTVAPLEWARPVEFGASLLAFVVAGLCGRRLVRGGVASAEPSPLSN